jgi:hypothetical protein
MRSGQEGHITRIASGCESDDIDDITKLFEQEIESMAPGRMHLHLTPDYSRIPKKNPNAFKYFNKPFGVRHWMEHALGYPHNHERHDDSIVILLDPDQIMMRPFTNDFTGSSEIWRLTEEYEKNKKKRDEYRKNGVPLPAPKLKIEHGSPFSQQYGYGIQWLRKVAPDYVFQGMLPTPVANMTRQEAFDYYMAMGPPYVATARDMYAIVTTWSDIVPRVHDEYPHLLAEYVYSCWVVAFRRIMMIILT